jgi:phosphatidylglycerol---prolipoprotein diacylglyceryl transferase
MHPILFNIGNFPIGTYGVLLALSAVAAIALGRSLALRAGMDPEEITDLYVYSLLASFVGAKVVLIAGDFREFADHPLRFVVQNLRSFGAFYGGFAAGVLMAIYFLRKHRISFWKAADVTAPCLALAQGLGRWGCFFAGCCFGKPTEMPWGMAFPAVSICEDGTRIHPWPIYESLGDLALFGLLLALFPRRRFTGQVFLAYVMGYAILRGSLEFFRGDEVRGLFLHGSVSLSQIAAALALPLAVAAYAVLKRRAERSA